jgi:GPH family glycoside/pentoside/hexuronide:cation symporter
VDRHWLLPTRELFFYGLPALPLQMILLITVIYLPSFYALKRDLPMSAVGAMFFLVRLWDAGIDTLVGGLSDRTRSRWGARKPWLILSTPLVLVCAGFLFMPPDGASKWYLGVWLFLFYLAWTMVQIPYLAWGAELSPHYNERSKVVAIREAFGTVGVTLATGLPLLILSADERDLSGVLRVAFVAILILLPSTVGVATKLARAGGNRHLDHKFSWREMLDAFTKNKLFVRYIGGILIWATSWNIFLASIVIIVEYALHLKGQYLSLVLLMNVAATVSMPIALRLSKRLDKHKTMCVAMAGFIIFYIAMSQMPPGHYLWSAAAFVFVGLCWAPALISVNSMIPDIVDVGSFKRQRNQAGVYIALYNMSSKMAQALGVGLGLPLLEAAGVNLKNPADQSGQNAINAVSLYFPAIATIFAIILLWTYPLTRRKHGILRIWLDRLDR